MLLEQLQRMQGPRRPVLPRLVTVWSGGLDAQAAREERAGVPRAQRATQIRLTGHSAVNYYGNDSITEAMHRASMGAVDAGGWR